MRRFALSVFAFAVGLSGCHGEPEPQTGGHCAPSQSELQVGIEKTRLCVGETAKPRASFSDGCVARDVTGEVQWTTTAPKVVRVDQSGRITALEVGHANVVAVQGGQTAGLRIVVAACP
jgi:hypothetical protein